MKHCIAILLAASLLFLLPSCRGTGEGGGSSDTAAPGNTENTGDSTAATVDESQFTFSAKDEYTDPDGATEINLNDGAVSSGSGWQLSSGSL